MPELPEVETVRTGLSRLILNKRVQSVSSDWPKSFPNAPADVEGFLLGASVSNIRRRAKVLLIDLSSDYTLVIHLKMTGQLVYRGAESFGAGHPTESLVGELPDRSTRVIFT
ncbi:MAG: DNA-formamidopyrimidine glycosylase family protein, partial [Candidatus Saccharimonadales bacterium]